MLPSQVHCELQGIPHTKKGYYLGTRKYERWCTDMLYIVVVNATLSYSIYSNIAWTSLGPRPSHPLLQRKIGKRGEEEGLVKLVQKNLYSAEFQRPESDWLIGK